MSCRQRSRHRLTRDAVILSGDSRGRGGRHGLADRWRVEFDEQQLAAYAQLEKASASVMLDAIDDAVDMLESDLPDA